jgi:hypothetical protein
MGVSRLKQSFTADGGIWYCTRRLEKEGALEARDLDFSPFFDAAFIKKVTPVMHARSPLFHSLALWVHFSDLPHSGTEASLARVRQHYSPVGDPRSVISAIRRACSKCRLLLKQVVGVELADLHPLRTTIAPPFFAVQMDVVMGFRAKPMQESRKSFTANALVVVCLLSSATSILVMDGLSTQSVVLALERHASRYGVPKYVFVDSGTQLEKLKDTSFSLRDLEAGITPGRRFHITVSTPRAHEQQGRVEAKAKAIRAMLQRYSDTCNEVNTLLGWETTFMRIADQLDNLPIARGTASAPTDLGWEVITPNRLKLGRNNHRQLEGEILLSNAPQNMLERNRLLAAKWYEIFISRLDLLVPKAAPAKYRDTMVGDVVLFVFIDNPIPKMNVWKLGRVTAIVSRTTVEIRYTSTPGGPPKTMRRAAR